MLIVSQHARLLHLRFPRHTVFRVNAAWVSNRAELYSLLSRIKNPVFLDFPDGRLKPPRPVLGFDALLDAMRKFKNIKYFGLSNTEGPEKIIAIRQKIPVRIKLIPKIESKNGIGTFEEIIAHLRGDEKYIMLDKEDLYLNLNKNNTLFKRYLSTLRKKCLKNNIRLLELQGVIFCDL